MTDFAADFAQPPARLRGIPFWAWNGALDRSELLAQLDTFKAMGMGGAMAHPRTGLATTYLGDEYLEHLRACCDHAAATGQELHLYDEDRWPSGYAGGMVTADPTHRARYLLFTTAPYGSAPVRLPNGSGSFGMRTENGRLIARFAVTISNGAMIACRRLTEAETTTDTVWHVYLEQAGPTPWFNDQTYLDVLSPAAVDRFIEVTHAKLKPALGKHWGTTAPTIFTDEPQTVLKGQLSQADATDEVCLPWSEGLFDLYAAEHGERLEDHLMELIHNCADGAVSARYRYHRLVAERFAACFGDRIGQWCAANGISLTGHLMAEDSLWAQTWASGDAMRPLRHFQIPAIDILCDRFLPTTAIQCRSVARQCGRSAMMSELYGVTGWHADLALHLRGGNWQAALGVTRRVHHLAWMTMAGEAKRDYPAPIDGHAPWATDYTVVEDHFARLAAATTRGTAVVRVAVLHPIESMWLQWGPQRDGEPRWQGLEARFQELCRWLVHDLCDFDYLAESLFAELCPDASGPALRVGAMAYDVVVVADCTTLRATTLERLRRFVASGGRVVVMGEAPSLVDGVPALIDLGPVLKWDRLALLSSVEPHREVMRASGPETLVYQLRHDHGVHRLLIANHSATVGGPAVLRVRGTWQVRHCDTMSGTTTFADARNDKGWTTIAWTAEAGSAALFELLPGVGAQVQIAEQALGARGAGQPLGQPSAVSLDEPNALVISRAEWRWNDGDWQGREETLRITNLARNHAGLVALTGEEAQPWSVRPATPVLGRVTLRVTLDCAVAVPAPRLAIEAPDGLALHINGAAVPTTAAGWWIDRCLTTIPLPNLAPGVHILEITLPLHCATSLEWMYLLGDFGVSIAGTAATLTAPVRHLRWGDWTTQGLPFYAGSVTYHCRTELPANAHIAVPERAGALVRVAAGGTLRGRIVAAPWRLDLGLPAGTHELELTCVGTRCNAFGMLHLAHDIKWMGPNAYRTSGTAWTDAWRLRSQGILAAPLITR